MNTVQGEAANAVLGDATSTVQGEEAAEGKAPEAAAAPLGTPAVVTGDAPDFGELSRVADGEQKTEVVDESGHLDVVA